MANAAGGYGRVSEEIVMSFELPGRVLETHMVRNNRLALVDFGGTHRPIFLDLVPEAKVGDYVSVHVGFATAKVSVEEARKAYAGMEPATQAERVECELELEEALPATRRRQKQG
jgi:hydrogenase expression/formation protein HypC